MLNRICLSFALGILDLLTSASEPGPLVIVGGGSIPHEALRRLVESGGGRDARVLVVPFASGLTNAGASAAAEFHSLDARSVEVLSPTNRAAARVALERATVIWFTGGDQSRLMDRLNELGVAELIRELHARGVAMGGTSAGAAVMSKVMIAGDAPTPGEPQIAQGLGLWPGVVVDQHFVKRGREPRLRRAVELHRDLVGVGIDEDTAVVVRGNGFEVIGQSTVTVVDGRSQQTDPERTLLSNREKFLWQATSKKSAH